MEKLRLDFDCTFDTVGRTMTCEWLGGRVELTLNFNLKKIYVSVDGKLKDKYDNIPACQLASLQRDCQLLADKLETRGNYGMQNSNG